MPAEAKKKELIFVVGGAEMGKRSFAEREFPEARLIPDYHSVVREQLAAGLDPGAEAEKLLAEIASGGQTVVITSDELGCGLVPMERSDREYREINGRVNCGIAARADRVYRVLFGIGQRIK